MITILIKTLIKLIRHLNKFFAGGTRGDPKPPRFIGTNRAWWKFNAIQTNANGFDSKEQQINHSALFWADLFPIKLLFD